MTQGTEIPLDISNTLVDPAAYADGRVHEALKWLRANMPLAKASPDNYEPFWVVTKHADIQDISSRNKVFANGERQIILTKAEDARQMAAMRDKKAGPPGNLILMDPPQHGPYRLLTQNWFLPSNLKKLEAGIRETARRDVNKMLATGGRCDFVSEVATGYPLHIIMNILGVPEEDEPLMLRLTQGLFTPNHAGHEGEPELTTEQKRKKLEEASAEFGAYFTKLAAEKQSHPTSDLATVIANAEIRGEPISLAAKIGYYTLIATAGHDTTSNGTAGVMLALCQNPHVFEQVKNDPSLLPALIEESVRWTTPVKHFMRSALEDTTVGDQPIAKDDLLMLSYLSANRDEDVFEDPEVFRIDRGPNKHIAFGHGAHVCLGQLLARMEMRILMEELLPRVKSVSLDGDVKMAPVNFISGPESIPLKFEAA